MNIQKKKKKYLIKCKRKSLLFKHTLHSHYAFTHMYTCTAKDQM